MNRAAALVGRRALFPVVLLLFGFGSALAQSQYTNVEIVVKDKKFVPAELKVPANARIVIQVKNQDAVAMEFESKSLKVEKVIAGKSKATVQFGPLKPGKYKFEGEFNSKTAQGVVVVE